MAVAAGVVAGAYGLHAQMTGHYPAGVEGIKCGSIPPPGVYLRDYNVFYGADRLEDAPPGTDFSVFSYVNAPRPIWITDLKVLGGYYGMDALIPIFSTDVDLNGADFDAFTVGDIFIEPITLSWHWDKFDLGVGYGFWAPVSDYDAANPAKPGKGFWSHMLTLGGTYFPDANKTWALSLLNRFEIHHKNTDAQVTPGESYTLEWGVSKTVWNNVDVGAVGYYAQQLSRDTGAGVTWGDLQARVFAAGAEVASMCPKIGLMISLRYLHEFEAKGRPEGDMGVLTLTKPF